MAGSAPAATTLARRWPSVLARQQSNRDAAVRTGAFFQCTSIALITTGSSTALRTSSWNSARLERCDASITERVSRSHAALCNSES